MPAVPEAPGGLLVPEQDADSGLLWLLLDVGPDGSVQRMRLAFRENTFRRCCKDTLEHPMQAQAALANVTESLYIVG